MAPRIKAVPLEDSDDGIDELGRESDKDSEGDNDELSARSKRIKLLKEKTRSSDKNKRLFGGIIVSSEDRVDQSTSASLSAAEKKGLKEVEELQRELDLRNTFSRETNRRDEDAEMNKYIDEQIRLRREAAKKERERKVNDPSKTDERRDQLSELSELFSFPAEATDKIDDILLHSLSKNLASTSDERSEAMLSSQMLNGIPEVDLGISEKIRTIEATEEAKLRLVSTNSRGSKKSSSAVPVNFSTNFQQHRSNRDNREGELKTSKSSKHVTAPSNEVKTTTEAVVVVGEEPDEIEYRLPTTGERPPPRGKASDDYYLSKFKRNNRK